MKNLLTGIISIFIGFVLLFFGFFSTQDGDYVQANKLSIGTIDQLYLSLRLATLDSMAEEKIPIILDEAFSHFDDKRLENILQYINNKFGDRQLIILTCNRREEQVLNNLKMKYNLINL